MRFETNVTGPKGQKAIKSARKEARRGGGTVCEYFDENGRLIITNAPEDWEAALSESQKIVFEQVDLFPSDGTDAGASKSVEVKPEIKPDTPKLLPISSLKSNEPFSGLFEIANETIDAISQDMVAKGYDTAHPIVVQKGTGRGIDGHTRLRAAKKAGLTEISVIKKAFADDAEAIEYAVKCQKNRRNLTGAGLLHALSIIDQRYGRGGDRRSQEAIEKSKFSNEKIENSAEKAAAALGVSTATVLRARTVNDHADEETRRAIEAGEKTVSRAYTEIAEQRREKKQSVNRLFARAKTGHWFDATWSPVSCDTYSGVETYKFSDSASRNLKIVKSNPIIDLSAVRRNILVHHDFDILAPCVPEGIVCEVLESIYLAIQFDFILLTKYPERIICYNSIPNLIVGTEIASQEEYAAAITSFESIKAKTKLALIHPSAPPFHIETIAPFNWIIVKPEADGQWLFELLSVAKRDQCRIYFCNGVAIKPTERQAQQKVKTTVKRGSPRWLFDPNEEPWCTPMIKGGPRFDTVLTTKNDEGRS